VGFGEDHVLHDGNFGEGLGHDGDLELNHGEYHYGGVGHEVPDEGHGVGHDGDLALNHGDFHDEHHYVGVLDEDHDGDLGMNHGEYHHFGGVGNEVLGELHGVGHDGDLALNHGDFHDEHHYVGVLDEDHDGDLGMNHGEYHHFGGVGNEVLGELHGVGHDGDLGEGCGAGHYGDLALNQGDFQG
jgi:hypothetical protein